MGEEQAEGVYMSRKFPTSKEKRGQGITKGGAEIMCRRTEPVGSALDGESA